MNRTTRPFTRLAVLATTVLGLVLATASQATAQICVDPSNARPRPCPTTSDRVYHGSSTTPIRQVTDNSTSTLQWVLLAAAVLAAIAIAAVLMRLVQRHRVTT